MNTNRLDLSLLKRPSAYIPMLMSLAGLALIFGHVSLAGNVRQEDEGAAAYIWQLLMAGQLPFLAWFAIQWLPRRFREALPVLVLLAGLGLANLVTLYWFESHLQLVP
jgi:hypothetical protein